MYKFTGGEFVCFRVNFKYLIKDSSCWSHCVYTVQVYSTGKIQHKDFLSSREVKISCGLGFEIIEPLIKLNFHICLI